MLLQTAKKIVLLVLCISRCLSSLIVVNRMGRDMQFEISTRTVAEKEEERKYCERVDPRMNEDATIYTTREGRRTFETWEQSIVCRCRSETPRNREIVDSNSAFLIEINLIVWPTADKKLFMLVFRNLKTNIKN